MKLSKYTQSQFNFAKENELMTEGEIDYRTKLAIGMTEEQRQKEFDNWVNSLSPADKNDFLYIFGKG